MQDLEPLGAPSEGTARRNIRMSGKKLIFLEAGRAVAAMVFLELGVF